MIKATDRKLVVGLEIGTAKVAALVGEVLPDGMVNIIGVGSCPSRGMDKGGVNDLESVVKCVQRAIDRAGIDGRLPDLLGISGAFRQTY